MINTFKVTSLKGIGDHDLEFNPDLNILTGKNGSGKTTLLKLIWYMLSPNLERIVPEIDFCTAKLITDDFTVSIEKKSVKRREEVTIEFKEKGKQSHKAEFMADESSEPEPINKVEEINRRIMTLRTSSVFFPTFRRIEGGFSIEPQRRYHQSYLYQVSSSLSDAMSTYSKMMTVHRHKFVATISTADIEDLLTKQYADVSDRTNALHTKLSKFIAGQIGQPGTQKTKIRSDKTKLRNANQLIEAIRRKHNKVEKERNNLMKPFLVLSSLITTIFKDKGIRISSNLAFGETKEAIQARILSAGEKQMLSFLCYNAFNRNAPIFIDEPELSLHIDWQRILFSTLKDQGTENQFIVSTHSPFIYSKYPEKELILHIDRGEN